MMDTQEQIILIFREVLSIDVPSPDTDIIAAGLLDSLALVTLLFEVEQRFAIRMPLESLDIESMRSVQRIATVVEELGADEGRTPPLAGGLRP